ncbi:hypothetical protein C8R45DRAFT_1097278 [Mycena sanguinolenta]|nr:hypothetical protein C8R45DRAFT_1097278 [Mycena sanguinolenta]
MNTRISVVSRDRHHADIPREAVSLEPPVDREVLSETEWDLHAQGGRCIRRTRLGRVPARSRRNGGSEEESASTPSTVIGAFDAPDVAYCYADALVRRLLRLFLCRSPTVCDADADAASVGGAWYGKPVFTVALRADGVCAHVLSRMEERARAFQSGVLQRNPPRSPGTAARASGGHLSISAWVQHRPPAHLSTYHCRSKSSFEALFAVRHMLLEWAQARLKQDQNAEGVARGIGEMEGNLSASSDPLSFVAFPALTALQYWVQLISWGTTYLDASSPRCIAAG